MEIYNHKISLRRITSSGRFIPEVDGLRFIAITAVVLFHVCGYLRVKGLYAHSPVFIFFNKLFANGNFGVQLFFVISGFILGLPFAKHYLLNEKKVKINEYFLRRVTRIEPPYIIALIMMFFLCVYIRKTIPLAEAVPSFICSLFYIHNIVYPHIFPKLNFVTWSLEIEVQFYVLAPLIAYLFAIRPVNKRRLVITLLILAFSIFPHFKLLPFGSVLDFMHYFLAGFLLADFFLLNTDRVPKSGFDWLIGIALFVTFWLFKEDDFKLVYQQVLWTLFQLACLFTFYYYALVNRAFKVLTFKAVTNIGGMCYSIYLIHAAVMSGIGKPLLRHSFSNIDAINYLVYIVIVLFGILSISSLFFLLIERPCMKKYWYRSFFPSSRRLSTTDETSIEALRSK